MLNPSDLNVAGLISTTLGALLMFFFPPTITVYTENGAPLVGWAGEPTASGRWKAKYQRWLSRGAVLLLLLGFSIQLGALLIDRAADPSRKGHTTDVAPPCKNGSANCKPWERAWSSHHIEPGSVVDERGNVVPPQH